MRWCLFSLLVAHAGCFAERAAQHPSDLEGGRTSSGSASAATPVAEALPASAATGTSGFDELPVPGFLPAVVFAPASTPSAPLIVASHGAGGMPEWECEYWRRLSRGRAFLLCLRGERTSNASPSGYFYRTHLALGREFRAALAAFRERFASAPRSAAIYAGFSQGAIMGAPMIVEHAAEFPYLTLIEGGYEYWSAATARSFARHGGKRVLFVCGTQWCADKSEIPARWLRQANVEVRIEHAPGAGHTPGGEVMTRTSEALPWLTAGDAAWSDRWASRRPHRQLSGLLTFRR